MRLWCGILLGSGWAIVDALLLYGVTRAARERPQEAKGLLGRVFAARYLLSFAVLAIGLLLPRVFDPLWVVLPLLLQKGVLVVLTVIHK